MIYGANGYSGSLVAREAKARGLNPVLAGRSEAVEGLVSTAYYTTGIPNIEVFSAMPPSQVGVIRALGWLTRIAPVRAALLALAGRFVKGDEEAERKSRRCVIWGEVAAPDGRTAELRLEIPHGYAFTAAAAAACAQAILEGPPRPGALTPTQAFGTELCLGLPGVSLLA
jgi:short subunit dehydrogenase-like uncharacterized protein